MEAFFLQLARPQPPAARTVSPSLAVASCVNHRPRPSTAARCLGLFLCVLTVDVTMKEYLCKIRERPQIPKSTDEKSLKIIMSRCCLFK